MEYANVSFHVKHASMEPSPVSLHNKHKKMEYFKFRFHFAYESMEHVILSVYVTNKTMEYFAIPIFFDTFSILAQHNLLLQLVNKNMEHSTLPVFTYTLDSMAHTHLPIHRLNCYYQPSTGVSCFRNSYSDNSIVHSNNQKRLNPPFRFLQQLSKRFTLGFLIEPDCFRQNFSEAPQQESGISTFLF